jgi:hypothetical protein
MGRKKAAAPTETQIEADNPVIPLIEDEKDTSFDPAELERQEKPKQYQPDPHLIERISLGDGPDAPQMRLYRNNRMQQMAIVFDEKPEPEQIAKLRENGFRWRNDDGAWTKQIDRDAKWKTQVDAERIFRDIGNAIRQEQGLGPVAALG